MTIDLTGSPYSIEETGRWAIEKAAKLQQRAGMLREQGRLTDQTLRAYFGDKRFEQIAESNAIEGSTLSVGETQLAASRSRGTIPSTRRPPSTSRRPWNAWSDSPRTALPQISDR